MATEYPNRLTLKACLFMGTKPDLTKNLSELSELYPANVIPDPKGWKFVNVTPQFVEELKSVFISDKLKFTEAFEMSLMWHLGWVIGRKFTTLHLDCDEPALDFEPQAWKWVPIKGDTHGEDDGSNGNDS